MPDETGYAMDWDSPVENEGEEFTLLPAGSEANFEVLGLDKSRVSKPGNYTGCPMAKMKIAVRNEHGSTVVNESLILHSKMEWKICQFFTSVGFRKHGEKLQPQWNRAVGAKGRCKLLVSEYESTKNPGTKNKNNKIDKFLDPPNATAAKATATPEATTEVEDDIAF